MNTCNRCGCEHTETTKRCASCKERERESERQAVLKVEQTGLKRCPSCKREHNLESKSCGLCKERSRERSRLARQTTEYKEYHKQYQRDHRKTPKGKIYAKNVLLKKKYNITVTDYNRMLEQQGGACAVIGCGSKDRLCVDHDHKTGKVRAIVCNGCNAALGHARESRTVLNGLISYIETHSS